MQFKFTLLLIWLLNTELAAATYEQMTWNNHGRSHFFQLFVSSLCRDPLLPSDVERSEQRANIEFQALQLRANLASMLEETDLRISRNQPVRQSYSTSDLKVLRRLFAAAINFENKVSHLLEPHWQNILEFQQARFKYKQTVLGILLAVYRAPETEVSDNFDSLVINFLLPSLARNSLRINQESWATYSTAHQLNQKLWAEVLFAYHMARLPNSPKGHFAMLSRLMYARQGAYNISPTKALELLHRLEPRQTDILTTYLTNVWRNSTQSVTLLSSEPSAWMHRSVGTWPIQVVHQSLVPFKEATNFDLFALKSTDTFETRLRLLQTLNRQTRRTGSQLLINLHTRVRAYQELLSFYKEIFEIGRLMAQFIDTPFARIVAQLKGLETALNRGLNNRPASETSEDFDSDLLIDDIIAMHALPLVAPDLKLSLERLLYLVVSLQIESALHVDFEGSDLNLFLIRQAKENRNNYWLGQLALALLATPNPTTLTHLSAGTYFSSSPLLDPEIFNSVRHHTAELHRRLLLAITDDSFSDNAKIAPQLRSQQLQVAWMLHGSWSCDLLLAP